MVPRYGPEQSRDLAALTVNLDDSSVIGNCICRRWIPVLGKTAFADTLLLGADGRSALPGMLGGERVALGGFVRLGTFAARIGDVFNQWLRKASASS